jgi:hypothetical protein
MQVALTGALALQHRLMTETFELYRERMPLSLKFEGAKPAIHGNGGRR